MLTGNYGNVGFFDWLHGTAFSEDFLRKVGEIPYEEIEEKQVEEPKSPKPASSPARSVKSEVTDAPTAEPSADDAIEIQEL